MDEFKIKITGRAFSDLESIYDYIHDEKSDPEGAERVYENIKTEINKLDKLPNRFPTVQIKVNPYSQLRYFLVGKYIVVYDVKNDEKEVKIRRILLLSSNWKREL